MPEHIIKKFQKKYGKKKGKGVFYATAKVEDRDPETFEKESICRLISDIVIFENGWMRLIPKNSLIIESSLIKQDTPE